MMNCPKIKEGKGKDQESDEDDDSSAYSVKQFYDALCVSSDFSMHSSLLDSRSPVHSTPRM